MYAASAFLHQTRSVFDSSRPGTPRRPLKTLLLATLRRIGWGSTVASSAQLVKGNGGIVLDVGFRPFASAWTAGAQAITKQNSDEEYHLSTKYRRSHRTSLSSYVNLVSDI